MYVFPQIFDYFLKVALHKKWSYSLRIAPVNVTKKFLMENFFFFFCSVVLFMGKLVEGYFQSFGDTEDRSI